ncbi:yip1 domain-containing [Pyrenophora seminiperda CCB06]|uniref:Yip1 domain-containing n=1 Tax=Pyrenophora seminiperda CCB06 TaxID=1302712 RepID=A0A3M7MG09_9PLEO|nr:yip1 domain-containing [Pyrenophora seminiperda CCB06]
MAAMMPSAATASSPYDSDAVERDLIDPDDATLDDLDDPLQATSDRAPLTGNMQRGGAQTQSYLTSTIPGEDRRAPTNTIDETVWETLSRDLFAIWEKMKQVLYPKYLLGGMMQRGGGIGAAERGESDGSGLRNIAGRWPDADVILQGGMSEGLRDWDLWGPLIFCLLLSLFLSWGAKGDQKDLVFSGVFAMVWIGEAVVTLQIKLLGGNIAFFQSISIIGYTLFPLVVASILSAVGIPMIVRIPVYLVLIAWSLAAGVSIMGGSGVVRNRVGIAVYPLFTLHIKTIFRLNGACCLRPHPYTDPQQRTALKKRTEHPSRAFKNTHLTMTDTPEEPQAAARIATSTTATKDTIKSASASPARSDKSSDSEGKNVREKLKDTQIDSQAKPDAVRGVDQPMNEAPNGNVKTGDQSVSGSDSERGRLRRKRSREDFEDEAEADKHPEKKTERHSRKRSRDITKDLQAAAPVKPTATTIPSIKESDTDEQMTSPSKNASATATTGKASSDETSPKNKRTRDQIENDNEAATETLEGASANGKPVEKAQGEERDTKRLRDKEGDKSTTDVPESKTKIPPGSGFANFSASSPFAAMAAKPSTSKPSDKPETLPQTSDDKFKSSGFGGFASSTASPFGGFGSSKSSSSSPFGAGSGGKLATFASSTTPSTSTGGGFGGLGSSGTSGFGGSTFGGSLGGGFGGLGGSKSGASFAAPGGNLEIKGLKEKETPFGAAAVGELSDDEDGDDEDPEKGTDKEERQSSQPLLSQQPQETGEEGEETIWTGRARLYNMSGEGANRAWKERGVGTIKFNITVDEPKKARFVLRAEGTHRLLLNAAVTRNMVFGGDAKGEKPKDTRLLFNSPNTEGELEMHLLKLKAENAQQLWQEVTKVQEEQL